ncbi:bifunctional 4-hydroxy-2-oxoglutarate aldolase/2-dehydro-3-deoxy-phosphogluconate aldolase [Glaciihabitans sp. UYNi722]|uniref:bifunctional 4-hydroxy-2-oxoglutarate aldolase/2-dehydro-3-deoxy-phosphogluconate aldolase n=1 Tax=Glaciihabitans sp. UYNi722 TaxID=3156344 RepID=UPI00339B6617
MNSPVAEDRRIALEQALARVPLVGIIRLGVPGGAEPAARALLAGGLTAVEVALTTPDAAAAISAVRSTAESDVVIGAGSVRTVDDVRAVSTAGADFIVTPTFNREVLAAAIAAGIPVLCGAFTPSELDAAQNAGATFVKLFPASQGGPGYLREVRAPMPDLRIIPTGGVNLDNLTEWFRSGAHAVAVGSALVSNADADAADWAAVTIRAEGYVAAVAKARD